MRMSRIPKLALVALGMMAGPARADFIVDQQFVPPPATNSFKINLDNSVLGNVFQTFVPSLTSLDVFTYNLQDANPGNASGGSFFVQILNPNLTTVLGTSATIDLSDGFGSASFATGSEAQFFFSTPVPLTPGTTYAARVRKSSGDSFFVLGNSSNGYPNGSYGTPTTPGDDLYFSEGVSAVPEPSTLVLGTTGLLLALAVPARAGGLRCVRILMSPILRRSLRLDQE